MVLVHWIERIIRVVSVDRVFGIVRIVAVDGIERAIGIIGVSGIARVVRLILHSRVEDVVVALVARIEAHLGIARYGPQTQHRRKQHAVFYDCLLVGRFIVPYP